jgi:hypothetical protein
MFNVLLAVHRDKPAQWKSTWCTVYFRFISIINFYMFRVVLLLVIRRYYSVYTYRAIGMWHTYSLHGAESFLRSQTVCSQSRNSQHFMKPEGSLPHSQVPATYPYPEQARSNPYLHIPLPEDPSNIILPSAPGSPQLSLSLRFRHQNPVHASPVPIRATCPAHLNLLSFITRTILGEEYRSFSSSLYSFLHSPVTSSLLGLVCDTHDVYQLLYIQSNTSWWRTASLLRTCRG